MQATDIIVDQVFRDPAVRDIECWRVAYGGKIEPATFNGKGAALAYLAMLQAGRRRPEAK
jgi:hypothetical protein